MLVGIVSIYILAGTLTRAQHMTLPTALPTTVPGAQRTMRPQAPVPRSLSAISQSTGRGTTCLTTFSR